MFLHVSAHAALIEIHLGGLKALGHRIEPSAAVGRPIVAQVPALLQVVVVGMAVAVRRGGGRVVVQLRAVAQLTDGAGALEVGAGVVGTRVQHHLLVVNVVASIQQVVLTAAVAVGAAATQPAVAGKQVVMVMWRVVVGIVIIHHTTAPVDLPRVRIHRRAVDNIRMQQIRLLLLLLLLLQAPPSAAMMRRRSTCCCRIRLLHIIGMILWQTVRSVQIVRLLIGRGGVGGGGAETVLL